MDNQDLYKRAKAYEQKSQAISSGNSSLYELAKRKEAAETAQSQPMARQTVYQASPSVSSPVFNSAPQEPAVRRDPYAGLDSDAINTLINNPAPSVKQETAAEAYRRINNAIAYRDQTLANARAADARKDWDTAAEYYRQYEEAKDRAKSYVDNELGDVENRRLDAMDQQTKDLIGKYEEGRSKGRLAGESLDAFRQLMSNGMNQNEIDSFADAYSMQRNKAEAEESVKYWEEKTRDASGFDKAILTIGSVPANLSSGLGAIEMAIGRAINPDRPIDRYSQANRGYWTSKAIRDTVQENMSNTGKFFYGTATSMLDSAGIAGLAALGVPPTMATSLLGGAAATSTMQEAIDKGLPPERAILTGALAGVAESFFESFSLERILKPRSIDAKTVVGKVTQILRNMGLQAFTEGSEEIATDIANTITDMMVNHDQSETMSAYNDLIDHGYEPNEAKKIVVTDLIKQYFMSFLGGALAGGVMGGAATGINIMSNGLSEYNKAIQLAEEATRDTREADQEAAYRAMDLLRNRDITAEENLAPADQQMAQEAYTSRIESQTRIDEAKSHGANEELLNYVQRDPNNSQSGKISPFGEMVLSAADEQYNRMQEIDRRVNGALNEEETATALDKKMALAEEYANTFGKSGSREFMNYFTRERAVNSDLTGSFNQFRMAYNAMLNGEDLGEETIDEEIWEYAKKAAAEDLKRMTKTFGNFGAVENNDAYKSLSVKNQRVIRALARATGSNFVVQDKVYDDDGVEVNGKYKNGTIYLSLNADDPIRFTAIHETVHKLRLATPAEFGRMAEIVYNNLSAEEKAKYEAFNTAVRGYSASESLEEIVADAYAKILEGEDLSVYNEETRGFWQKIKDAIKELRDKVRAYLRGEPRTSENYQTFSSLESQLSNMVDAFENALKSAQNRTESAQNRAKDGLTGIEGIDKFVSNAEYSKKLRMVTFFAGAGLVDQAVRGRVEGTFAVEKKENIGAIYMLNNGKHMYVGDVQDVNYGDIKGPVEYFHASPVCKDFSKANQSGGETDLDEVTAKATAEAVERLHPLVVTVENVPDYKKSNSLKHITDALDKLGYTYDIDTYNSADYGSAVSRDRMFLRAVLNGPLPAMPNKTGPVSWYDAIFDLIPTLPETHVPKWMQERIDRANLDTKNIKVPILVLDSMANGKARYVEYNKPMPSPTTSSTDGRIFMPDGSVYRLTPRAMARIFGLPDSFQLPKAMTTGYLITANGVPLPLTQAVVNPLLDTISDDSYEEVSAAYSRKTVSQEISSKDTSLNQVPGLFKDTRYVSFGKTNIDIGGGAFDAATNYLADRGTQNMVFDPFNRGREENESVLDFLVSGNKADTATCANVLNVIKEKDARLNVILEMAKAIKEDGKAYFSVYEGDGSGNGKRTTKGWQNNRKTATYVNEIKTYFDNVESHGKTIVATNPKQNLPEAYWEVEPGDAVRYSRKASGLDDTGASASIDISSLDNPTILDNGNVIETDDIVGKLSRKSWERADKQKIVADLIAAGFSEAEAKQWINDVSGVAAQIAANQLLDYVPAPNQTALKHNDEYFFTFDLSTLCKKRTLYQGTFNAIVKRLGNKAITAKQTLKIRDLLKQKGYEAPCGFCYVESNRKNFSTQAKKWLDNYSGDYIPQLWEVTSSDGLSQLMDEHPVTYKDFMSSMKKLGSGNPRVVQLRTDYIDEIMRLSNEKVEQLKAIGGLRLQSYSDFEIVHMIDVMQGVIDMARKGLTAQAYTKVPSFAWIFGNTGIKINLSVVGDIDENGNLVFDSIEGINEEEAFRLREAFSKNVGTILVGKNKAHIIAAMKDSRIDFIIPYHRSGWSTAEYGVLGLTGYVDSTALQNEAFLDTVTVVDKKTGKEKIQYVKGPNYYPIDYWNEKLSGNENSLVYLNKCLENNRLPKFLNLAFSDEIADQYLAEHPNALPKSWKKNQRNGEYMMSIDGMSKLYRSQSKNRHIAMDFFRYAMEHNAEVNDGYWKTLIDFKMYDNDGNFAKQETVKPNFRMDMAKKFLAEQIKDYEENGINANKLPVAQDVVDDFVKGIEEGKYSRKTESIAPRFYSKLQREIENYKGDKIAASSVISYAKGRGVKDEEIKWSGIETFLDGKKTVSKAELLDYLRANSMEIVEQQYKGKLSEDEREDRVFGEAYDRAEKLGYSYDDIIDLQPYLTDDRNRVEWRALVDDGNGGTKEVVVWDLSTDEADDMTYGTRWSEYAIGNKDSYREFLYVLPNSDYRNNAMGVHWDKNGVLVHARVSDFEASNSDKILFVEEIQSDWHNLGHKSGYVTQEAVEEQRQKQELYDREVGKVEARYKKTYDEIQAISMKIRDKANAFIDGLTVLPYQMSQREYFEYVDSRFDKYEDSFIQKGILDEMKEYVRLVKKSDRQYRELQRTQQKYNFSIKPFAPDAPFKNNYTDFALKNLLWTAANEGYSYLAWSNAKIQQERWSDEYAEGYRIEYDQDIPSFMRKYVKQWGAKVQPVELYNKINKPVPAYTGEDGKQSNAVLGVEINDAMRESVLAGQPMYSRKVSPIEGQLSFDDLQGESAEKLERLSEYEALYNAVDYVQKNAYRSNGLHYDPLPFYTEIQKNDRLDFLRRFLTVGDDTVEAEAMELALNAKDLKQLRDIDLIYSWFYSRQGLTEGPAKAYWNDLHGIFEKAAESMGGENIGLVNGRYDAKYFKDLFRRLNSDKDLAALSQKVFSFIDRFGTRFEVKAIRGGASGENFDRLNLIVFDRRFFNNPFESNQKKASTILHEMIHAGTVYAMDLAKNKPEELTQEMRDAVSIIDSAYRQFKKDEDFKTEYGITTRFEFIAELSNPEFREKLKKKNLFQKIIDAIKKLFGIESRNALDGSSRALEYILDNPGTEAFHRFLSPRALSIMSDGMPAESESSFSRKAAYDVIATHEENLRLRRRVQELTEQRDRWKRESTLASPAINTRRLDTITKNILRTYSATVSKDEVAPLIQKAYEYLYNDKEPNATEFMRLCEEAARPIVDSIMAENQFFDDTSNEFLSAVKNAKFEIDPALFDKNAFSAFRKSVFGRMSIKSSTGRSNVDQIYSELVEEYPGILTGDAMGEEDMLREIAGAVDDLYRAKRINPYTDSMYAEAPYEEGVELVANTIAENYWDDKVFYGKTRATDIKERTMTLRAKQMQSLRDMVARRDEQLRAQAERNREKISKIRESQDRKEIVKRIQKKASDLSQKLLRPSDKKHIPEVFKNTVAEALASINLSSKNERNGQKTKRTLAFEHLRDVYLDLVKNEPGMISIDEDLYQDVPGYKSFLSQLIAMGDIPIDAMSMDQLQLVNSVLDMINASIRSYNTMFAIERGEAVYEIADDIKKYSENHRDRLAKNSTVSRLRLEVTDPYTFFHTMGDAGHRIYRALRDAQELSRDRLSQISEAVQRLNVEQDIQEMQEQRHVFNIRGRELVLTTAQLMGLYNLSFREQARQHIMGGGISQPRIPKSKYGREINMDDAAYKVTDSDLLMMFDELTSEQKALAREYQKLTQITAEWGNQASMEVFGYKKFGEDNYWPIHTAPDTLNSYQNQDENNYRRIKNMSAAKPLVQGASNRAVPTDIFKDFAENTAQMIDYSSWLGPMEDMYRLFNTKFFEYVDDQKVQTGSMKGVLNRLNGYGADTYYDNLLNNIQNGIKKPNSAAESVIQAAIGRAKAVSVGANIRVVVQQPTAIVRAGAVMNYGDLLRGVFNGVRPGNGWEKALQYSPIARIKNLGTFDQGNMRTAERELYGSTKILDKISDWSGRGAQWADAITWGAMWNAAEYQVHREHPEVDPQSNTFMELTNIVYTDMIDQTQVVDGILQRTQIMRSGSTTLKQVSAFMGEPLKALNVFMRAWNDATVAIDPAERSAKWKKVWSTAAVLASTAFTNAVVKTIIDTIRRRDKDKDFWEQYLEELLGIGGDNVVMDVLTRSNLFDELNPLTYVPLLKDGWSIFQGFRVERMDAGAFADIVQDATVFIQTMFGNSRYSTAYSLKSLVTSISRIAGVPAQSLFRDLWALWRAGTFAVGDPKAIYESDKLIYNMTSSSNRKIFYGDAYYALEKGDIALYDKIRGELEGVSSSDFDKRMQDEYNKHVQADPEYQFPESSAEHVGLVKRSSSGKDLKLEGALRFSSTDIISSASKKPYYSNMSSDDKIRFEAKAKEFTQKVQIANNNRHYNLYEKAKWVYNGALAAKIGYDVGEYILAYTAKSSFPTGMSGKKYNSHIAAKAWLKANISSEAYRQWLWVNCFGWSENTYDEY